MRRKIIISIFTVLAFSAEFSPADSVNANQRFKEATAKLSSGDFTAASTILSSLVKEEKFAPEVFLQLGNAHYRLGDIGEAALCYRRALLLDSNLAEAKQNLTFLKERVGFVGASPLASPRFLHSFSEPLIATMLTIGILVISIAGSLMLLPSRNRNALVLILITGIACASSSAFISKAKDSSRPDRDTFIVVQQNSKARTAPADSASTLTLLPPGSSAILVSVRGNWSYVELPDQLHGWVRNSSIKQLWPYDPEFSD